MLVLAGCGGGASSGSSASGARTAGPTSTPSAPVAHRLSGAYGLLLTAFGPATPGKLQLIKPDGSVAASVPIAMSSLGDQACGEGMAAVVQPQVSASYDEVYYRDGDNQIRMVVPPASSLDVTTVPGGPHIVSFFSVSPDDRRIAVLVEDLSAAPTIRLRLYVEDLRGGGHHADIYTTTVTAGKVTTLWPMGWHQGRLVLAVWAACTFESVPGPVAWHVVDAATAFRKASIGDASCIPSVWPSPAGVACFECCPPGRVRTYDWSGRLVVSLVTDTGATELSPSGNLLAGASGGGPILGAGPPTTTMLRVDGSGVVTSAGHMGCLWIDDSHLLAPDAVIAYPSGAATVLPQAGQCAGRFPGGL